MKIYTPLCFLLTLTVTLDAVNSFKDTLDTDESGVPEIGYQGTLFSQPGLFWIDFDPKTIESKLRYIPLQQDTYLAREIEILTVNMGIGEASNFTHLALDFHNRTLILVDQLNRRIVRVAFSEYDEPVYEVLFTGTSKHVNGITIDWVTDVVYWTDAAYDAIVILGLKYPNVAEILVQEDLDEPYGIVAYPTQAGGYLFWSDIGAEPKIERAELSGRLRKKIFPVFASDSEEVPTALLVDPGTERLYWLTKSGIVFSSDLDGKGIKQFSTTDEDYFDMDMYQGQRILSLQGSPLAKSSREDMVSMHIYGHQRKNEILIYGPMTEDKLSIKCSGVPHGVQVIDPNRQRNMFNPCKYSSCPGICVKPGFRVSEKCICSEYIRAQALESEGKSFCASGPVNAILLAKSDGIYHLERNFADRYMEYPSEVLTRVFPYQNHITAITSIIKTNYVYFYDAILKVIGRVSLSGSSRSETISLATDSVGDLAVDWIRGNLYWTEVRFRQILVSTDKGKFPVILVRNLVQPRAIVIQAKAGYMFWTDTGVNSIERAYLDGSGNKTLKKGCKVTAFAIDMDKDVLYWTDASSGAIYSSDFHGDNIRRLFEVQASHPIFTGLAVVNDYLVWSDNNWTSPRGVFAIDRIRGGYIGGYKGSQNTYDIIFHHRSNQPQGSEAACFFHKCAQLCLLQGAHRRCACTVGFKLGNDMESCERSFIDPMYTHFVFADQRLQQIFLIPVTHEYISLPLQHVKQPYAVAYDSFKDRIYWTDLEDKTISRASTKGSFQQIIASGQYFLSLAIDVKHRMLYYTAQSVYTVVGTLVVLHLDSLKSKVLADIPSPRTLAINPAKGFIFIADEPMSYYGSTPPSHIWRASMNGSNLIAIFESDTPINGLASQFDYIYFTLQGENNVTRSYLNGENRSIFVQTQMPLSLAVDTERLYWVDGVQRSIHGCWLSDCSSILGFGHTDLFVKPTSFAVYLKEDQHLEAHEYCVPTPSGLQCSEQDFVTEPNEESRGFCQIPAIEYGDTVDNKPGHVVPDGYITYVQCFPLHKTTNNKMVCKNGSWSNVPVCKQEYEICGTNERGYKIYRKSGLFYVHRGITRLTVLLIGGGGGGYDVHNNIAEAGSGGTSRFGDYLFAEGGRGGSLLDGGKGGFGMIEGGKGGHGGNCTAGGAAGQKQKGIDLAPGYSFEMFCGAGGLSTHCENVLDQINAEITAQWATPRNNSNAGQYGGGSGSRGGGAGGGGGFTEDSITVKPDDVVTVTVGEGGKPSYAEAGQGIVVVAWGDVSINSDLEKVQKQYNCTRIDEH
ncbi:hypothetical protein ACJMK2_012377 [Sinanodonta woodiana]|uniref:Uncharacterized protein n=1 Tax=Sinanodonta woodiana TaxID=1069815 RepID=A0ABD3VB29_SINWO